MITAGDFRNGVTFEMDGQVMQVVEFQHVKPGKGAAFVRTKMKNVITGAVTETSFNPTAKFESATVDRMTIARAMVENAPMIILDEATSSVDTRTEVLVQKAMDRLTRGRTSFVIAHRLSTIRDADLILVMDKGDIVESGTHEQLLEKGGLYKELYTSQFENK